MLTDQVQPFRLSDEQWCRFEPLIPPAKRGGNKRHVDVREVMNGIMYILGTGCQWRAIPKDLPPRSTLFDYLEGGETLDEFLHQFPSVSREQAVAAIEMARDSVLGSARPA